MRVPTSIGVYIPVDSPVHSLDALAKVVLTLVLTASLFMVDGAAGLGALGLVVLATIALSKVPWRSAARGLLSVGIILAFTLLAHGLRFGTAPADAVVSVWRLHVSAGGLATGVYFAARIVVLVLGTSLLTLTTSPVELAEAFERLMRPLARLGVPAHEIAMMLSIALRFIPTTAEEAERIITAQIARGARFDRGGPVRRARAYVPVLVPLFVGLFRRADKLALAMEARCYRGGEGRTRLRERRMGSSDWAVMLAGCALLIAVGVAL
ncbi:MAG: energy-coupling factor transporter transmembrane component T [Coriobacteriia bacterium]